MYRHFSVELITGCLRNVILTCSCSRPTFPLDTGCANPHLFQHSSLPDVPLFLSLFIPSHFPLATNKTWPFTGLMEKRCWNRSWPQTPYRTLNRRIHVCGVLCWWSPAQQLWDGFFVWLTWVQHACSQSEGRVQFSRPSELICHSPEGMSALSAASPPPVLTEAPSLEPHFRVCLGSCCSSRGGRSLHKHSEGACVATCRLQQPILIGTDAV